MAGSVHLPPLAVLALVLISLFNGARGQVACYTGETDTTCSGSSIQTATGRDCCLGDGISYNAGSSCQLCYVIGYSDSTRVLTLDEGEQASLTVQVLKPAAGQSGVQFTIMNGDNVADVRVGGADNPTGSLLFGGFGRSRDFTIRAEADQVGQEGVETFTIPLAINNNPLGIFIGPPAEVTVIDQSDVLVELTEADYQQREGQRGNVITARVLYNRDIANPITVTFFPVTYTRYEDDLGFVLPSGFPNREAGDEFEAKESDFIGTPIVITLPNPDGGTVRQVELEIPIIDDLINEHQETLVGFIEITEAVDEGTINLGRTAAQLIIDDNDDITIGFTQETYTFNEGEAGALVMLAKDSGIISERNDIAVTISLESGSSATQGSDFSVTLLNTRIGFDPSDQSINVPLSIIEDALPEGVESFTLSVDSADFGFGATRRDTYEETEIFIIDNDDVVVGFEQTLYTVAESDGTIQICVVVMSPPTTQTLPSSFTLVADTLSASAVGGSDFQDFNSLLPPFDNDNRRRCFDVTILEDEALENNEMFRALLALASDSGVTVNPAEATVTITDVDPLTIGLQQTMYTVNEGDPIVMVCAEVTSGVVGRETVVSLGSQDNTATAPSDYAAAVQLLTFDPGDTLVCSSFLIRNDEVLEDLENFRVQLATADPRVTVDPAQGTVNIVDNDAVRVGFQQLEYSVSENDGTVEVCAVIDQGVIQGTVIVIIDTGDGTALAGSDYTALQGGTLMFEAPSTRACTDITITNDQLYEIDEQFFGRLRSSDLTRVTVNPARDDANIEILDEDSLTIGFNPDSYVVIEGDTARVCASVRSGNIGRDVSLSFGTQDGTALRGSDYTFIGQQLLVFNSANTERCVDVATTEDSTFEQPEQFMALLVGDLPRLTRDPDQATVTIQDDDNIMATIGFTQPSYSVVEGQASVTVEVGLLSGTIPPNNEVIISFSTANQDAIASRDYTARQMSLTFSSSNTRMPISIPITDDSEIEDVERFLANLQIDSAAFPEIVLGPEQATVDIISNDVRIGFTQTTQTVSEADSGVPITLRVLEGVIAPELGNLQVTVSTADVTATDGSDYVGFTQQTFNFNSGQTEQAFSLPVVDDDDIEPTEQFAVLATSSAPGVLVQPNRVVVDIEDNDVIIGFSQTDLTVDEDTGTVDLLVTVLDGAIPPGQNRVVMLSTNDGTALASEDYVSILNRPLTFSSTQQSNTVPITITDDTLVEDNLESFVARLTVNRALNPGVTVQPSSATINIDDNDVVIGFVEPTTTTSETDDAVVFVAVMDGTIPPGEQYIVTLTTSDDTADRNDDYEPTTETLIFTSTTDSVSVTIPIIDDDDVEGREMFSASLRVDSSRFPVTLSPDTSDIVILDNDVVIGLDMVTYTTEEGTSVDLVARVIDGVIMQNTVVFITTTDGTATSPDDYTGLNRVPITFTPGATSRSVLLRTVEDNDVEDTETLTATLTVDNDIYPGVSLSPDSAIINIIDDDSVSVVLSSTEYRVVENEGAVQVCVDLIPQNILQRSLVVSLTTTPRTASDGPDFTGQQRTLTFASGVNQLCRDIPITNDDITERDEETFEVVITSNDPQVDIGTPNRANVIIEDDDPAVIGFEETQYSVGENRGSVPVVVLLREGELSDDVTVVFSTDDGTATRSFPSDYTATTRTLVFGPGNTRQTIAVPVSNDQVLEDNENFFANLVLTRNPDNLDISVDPSQTEIVITDFGDDVEIGLEMTSYTVQEDGISVEVCVRLQRGRLEREVEVDLLIADDTALSSGPNADYVLSSSPVTLTFDQSTSLQCVRVPITDDDDLEPDERFTVSLTTDDPDVTLDPTNGEVIITNDDDVTIGFQFPMYTVNENEGPQEVCVVVRNGGFQVPVRLTINSRDGTASSPSDYAAVRNRVVTFEPGSTEECFDVNIINDVTDEPQLEDLFLTVTTNQDGVILTPDTTRIVISDDDQVVIGFEQTAVTVFETVGSVELCAAILDGTLGRDVDVTLSTQPGTATAGVDYGSVSNAILRFSDSLSRQCTTVTIRADNVVEQDTETFTATLTDTPSEGIVLLPDLTTVNIRDETVARFGFERPTYTQLEDNMEEVCVVLLSPITLDRTVTVRVSSQDITANAPSDYTAVDVALSFVPGSTRECFNVDLLSDDILEETEQLQLSLVPTEERMNFDPRTTIVNILDNNDDQVVVGLETMSYTVGEGTPEQEVCATVREGSVDRNVLVTLATQPRSATGGGVDFGTTSADLLFNVGTTRACTRVPIVDDDIDENNEVFDIVLTTTETGISLAPDQGMVTIVDNDIVTIRLEPTSATVSEDDGDVEFCAAVTGDVTLGRSVQVTLSTQPGTATATADYGPRTEALVFDSSTSRQCVQIPIVRDTIVENNENFTVVLDSPDDVNVMPDRGIVTITDTSVVTPEFEQPDYSVLEDEGPAEVCVLVPDGQIGRETVIQLVTQPGTATSGVDYDAGPYSLTFSVGSTRACAEIGIPDDPDPEGDETVTISIPPSSDVTPPTPTTLTIVDDDVVIGFEETVYTVEGDEGQVELTVSVLDGQVSQSVVVQLNTRDGTAGSPDDYSTVSTQLTFSPTTTSVRVPVNIAPSVLNEQLETFFADLTLVSPGDDSVVLEPDEAEVEILPVGAARIGFESTEYVVDEDDGSVTVVVSILDGELSGDVLVNISTTDGSATSSGPDYATISQVLTFGPNTTTTSVSIPINDDNVVENVEDFIARISLRTSDANVVIGPAQTTVRINDNDVFTPSFELPEYVILENEGPVTVCVLVPDGQLERTATVTFSTADLVATANEDYSPQSIQLTFEPGQTQQCRIVPIIDDSVPEDNEPFIVRISTGPSGPVVESTVTIVDDDEECPVLIDIPFGTVTQTGRQVGDVATYQCNPGFELIGTATRTCTQIDPNTARFDGQVPVCRPLCQQLPDVQFGMVAQSGLSVGDTATYACNPGFQLVGPDMRVCTQINPGTAEFDGQAPICLPECEEPGDIPFGSVTVAGVQVGDTAIYSCAPGFELVGDSTRTCTQINPMTAEFVGPEPSCRPLCEDLPNPVSGSVSLTGNSVGDTATYSCILGFNLVGTITRTCEIVSPSTAEWSSEAPVCEPDCPVLLDIQFGSVVQTGRRPGDTATYSCNSGFELVGPQVRTCTQITPTNTAFDGVEPFCRPLCEGLPNPVSGSVSLTGNSLGDTATYACNPGFQLVGPDMRVCTQINPGTAEFDGQAPICLPECEEPGDIPFGSVTVAGVQVGDTAIYSCAPGFELVGDSTRTCTQINPMTAEFVGPEPSCRPLCEDLPNPVSGSVSLTGNSVGDTATYSCILGFNLVGTITRTCEIVSPSTAEWSSEAPVCEPDCPVLLDIQFGSVVQTGRRPGDTATYSCNSGFELVGPQVRTCTQITPTNTAFDGVEPFCRPLCEGLPNPVSGSVSLTGNSLGDTATYACNPGFQLVGPDMRVCTQINPGTAEFGGQAPICLPECEEPGDIPFGSVTVAGVQVGDTAIYSCAPGFELVGDSTRTCTQINPMTAEFVGPEPSCRPLCEDLPNPVSGSVSLTGNSVGDTATYSCILGFNLVGTITRTCEMVSPSTAEWNSEAPVCEPDCPVLLDIQFGSVVQTGRRPGDTATYSCNSGFELVGPQVRTCTQITPTNTAFDGVEPFCRPLCEGLPNPVSGSVSLTGNSLGDTATYSCNPGFNLVGTVTRTCQMVTSSTAEWSSEAPVCEPDCPVLLDIQFGSVVQTGRRPGDTATYSCNSGFELVGPQVRTCTQITPTNTAFDGVEPFCRPLCEGLPNPVSGSVALTGNSVGDTATYSCNPGFNLVGTVTRTCQMISPSTAEWSSEAPVCERITVRFEAPSYTFTESGGQGSITVIRTGVPSSPFTVRVTGGPSTQPNIERSAPEINRLITFEAGFGAPDRITIYFPLTDDDVALEDVERFFVDLSVETPDSGVVVVSPERTRINVLDDDNVTVGFGRPEATFNESDGLYRMCIVKDRVTAQRVTVEISDTPGTADRNQDYSPVLLRLVSIEPEDTRTCFSGVIIDDVIGGEGVEFFSLNIPQPTQPGVNVGLDTTNINIIDDDLVTVVMVRPTEAVPEVSGEARVCARKDIATAGPVSAIISTSPGKATDGTDYVGGSYTVEFGPEPNAVACATIGIVVDNVFEDIENFDTNLSPPGPGNVVIGPQDNTLVLIDDLGSDVVHDTLIGDPLLTVPLPENSLVAVPGVREASLCYEVHGRDDAWFNILSDGCVSVNAHYFRFDDNFNFVDQIAVRAIDERGNCKNILIELSGCTARIDGTLVTAATPYCTDGVFVRPSRQANRVRVSVPNCNETSNLVMWAICQRNTLMDPFDMMRSYTVDMIKFVIARGSNLGASSHGIIGQFWNIPISLSVYTGEAADSEHGQRYIIQVNHPDSDPRVFTGLLAGYSWEQDRSNCFYVGNRQAGTIVEVMDPNDPVIEGFYSDYETSSDFSTDFKFSHFDENRCL